MVTFAIRIAFSARMNNRERDISSVIIDAINPYRWIMSLRNMMFDKGYKESREFHVATICIGNISVGGTGKTPHTEYLIELLKANHSLAVLSRGYGRKSKGYIKAGDATPMPLIGDEPFQIKNKYPDIAVAVCERRVTGIEKLLAEEKGIDVILLDDAYQHRHVKAGLNILLIDSNRPIWCDRVLPFGRLRESAAGIDRADVVVITKCKDITPGDAEWYRNQIGRYKKLPVFFSQMRYGNCYSLFKDAPARNGKMPREVLLVTGIANPAPLKAEIERRGAKVTLMRFGDHHNFTTAELGAIDGKFRAIGCNDKAIITTEKDATRLLQRNDLPPAIKESTYVLPIKIEIMADGQKEFNQIIEDYVTENPRDSRIP